MQLFWPVYIFIYTKQIKLWSLLIISNNFTHLSLGKDVQRLSIKKNEETISFPIGTFVCMRFRNIFPHSKPFTTRHIGKFIFFCVCFTDILQYSPHFCIILQSFSCVFAVRTFVFGFWITECFIQFWTMFCLTV